METIYTVTGVVYDWPKSECRCFGWYPTFKESEEAVHSNRGGMDEAGYYKWIVIEAAPKGVYVNCIKGEETWYHYDGGQYSRIEKPKEFKGVVGWGIGGERII